MAEKKLEQEHRCGLYLCVATGDAGESACHVGPLLDTGKVDCLLVGPPEGGDIDAGEALALVEAAKARSVTVLVRDDGQLARSLKADGVHVSWHADIVAQFLSAREVCDSRAVVGADAGRSRHDAMSLGDKGADYVAFGIPAHVGDKEKARARQLDLITWWSEIFEVPSVAFDVGEPQHGRKLAQSGADFIACDMPAGLSGTDLKDWFDAYVAALAPDREGV